MNSKFLTLVIVIFITAGCSNKDIISDLSGTWQLSTYQYGASPEETVPENLKRIKLITSNHFTFIHYDIENKIITSSAGGRINYDGKTYIESIDFAHMGMRRYLDNKQTFTIKLDDDKMYLEGQLSDGLNIKEVWLKLK